MRQGLSALTKLSSRITSDPNELPPFPIKLTKHKWLKKPWPFSEKCKFILKTAKKGGKYILAGAMIGTGAEVASHLINGPHPDMSGGVEYILINNYSPSLVKVDNVESTHNASGTWIPEIWNPVTVVIILTISSLKNNGNGPSPNLNWPMGPNALKPIYRVFLRWRHYPVQSTLT